jgi:hypothetical protein
MGVGVPVGNETVKMLVEGKGGREVDQAQGLAREEAEPLLDLVHPGAMHRWEVEDKAGVVGEPGLDRLALVDTEVVEDQADSGDTRRQTDVQQLKEGNELPGTFAGSTPANDLARAGVEGSKEVEGAAATVLMLDLHWPPSLGRPGRRSPSPGLQVGLLVDTEHHFVTAQGPGVEVTDPPDRGREGSIAGDPGREPGVLAPGFQLVVGEDPQDGVGRDLLDNTICDQLPRQFGAIPEAQRHPTLTRQFAGQLDDVEGNLRGKRRASARGGDDP